MKVKGHHTGSIRVCMKVILIYHGICVFFMFSEAGLDLFKGDIVYDEVRDDTLLNTIVVFLMSNLVLHISTCHTRTMMIFIE